MPSPTRSMATGDKRPGRRRDDFAWGPGGQSRGKPDYVYVMVDDSVKVISRLHHIVATSRAGPHPKNIVVSADGTRVYVTGYDGSTSIISTADNTVKTFVLDRSTAEVVSPDRNYI